MGIQNLIISEHVRLMNHHIPTVDPIAESSRISCRIARRLIQIRNSAEERVAGTEILVDAACKVVLVCQRFS